MNDRIITSTIRRSVMILMFLAFGLPTAFSMPPISKSSTKKIFRVRLSTIPQSFDWNRATSGSESAVIRNLMIGLYEYDQSGQLQPVLAQSPVWGPNFKSLKITLKPGVVWEDGLPLTAFHFVDSFKRLLKPDLNSPNAFVLFSIQNARDYFFGKIKDFSTVGVQATGELELTFTFANPNPYFLNTLSYWATFPIRKESLSLALGPYTLKSRTATEIWLALNPKYVFKNRSIHPIDQVSFKVIPDIKTALKLYQSKELDYLLQVEDEQIEAAKKLGPVEITDAFRVVALLHLNPSRVHTQSPENRRALIDAIRNPKVLDALINTGGRAPSDHLIPPQWIAPPTADVLKLIQTPLNRGKLPETPTLLGYPDDSLSKSIAETIYKNADPLKIRIEAIRADQSQTEKRYDLVLSLFGLDYIDPDQILSSFLSQGTHDLFNYTLPDLTRILNLARGEPDRIIRDQFYWKAIHQLENESALVTPLFYRKRAFLLRPTFVRGPSFIPGSPVLFGLSK
jgi:oligopeptide transport system substrate-binding protein